MNQNWKYVPFSEICSWCKKSSIGSNDGKQFGKYKLFIASATKIKYLDEYLEDDEALVFGTGGNPCIYYVNGKFSYTNHTEAAKKKSSKIDLKFYYYYFQKDKYTHLASTFVGGGIKNSSKKKIGALIVPIPSLEEQHRIVERIEELFSELDKAVETLQTIRRQLVVYRQAVLKDAFEWLDDIVSMGEVSTMIDPQPSHRTPPEFAGGIPYIGVGDIDYLEKKLKLNEARKVNPNVLKEHLNRYTLHDGDFIMGKIGTIGKPFMIQLPQIYALSANVILIQPDADKIEPEYLFWQFSSPFVTTQLMKGKNETSQPAFGIQKARLINIKMCSRQIQLKIIHNIRERLSICDNIEKTVNTALLQAEALKQSILKQAFEGELIK